MRLLSPLPTKAVFSGQGTRNMPSVTIAGTEERHLAFLNPTLQSPTRFTEREKKNEKKNDHLHTIGR
jgi:hypothetical protein